MRTVIFDLDGTLADTSGDLIDAANTCFRGLGLGDLLVHGRDASTAMRGGMAMLRLGFSRVNGFGDDDIERQYPVLLAAYESQLDKHSFLFDGAREAVAVLSGQGYALGVCTNKPERMADALLTRLDFRAPFTGFVGADTLPVRKPDPRPFLEAVSRAGGALDRAVLIGDTKTDRDTARAAGVPAVLVTFGPDGQTVAELQPEALLHRYCDLPAVVRDLIG